MSVDSDTDSPCLLQCGSGVQIVSFQPAFTAAAPLRDTQTPTQTTTQNTLNVLLQNKAEFSGTSPTAKRENVHLFVCVLSFKKCLLTKIKKL